MQRMQRQWMRLVGAGILGLAASGCERGAAPAPAAEIPPPPRHAGVIAANMDLDVAPGDDFYRYVNGGWLARTDIPADRANYGTFTILAERAEQQVHTLLKTLAAQTTFETQEDRQLALTYRSFMDVDSVEKRGKQPIEDLMARITAVEDADQLPELLGSLAQEGIAQPLSFWVGQDARDATTYIAYLHQQGQIGLPDRSFYLDEDPRFVDIRSAYVAYMADMLGRLELIPDDAEAGAATAAAEAVLALEAQLAEAHWTRVESRDRERTYNRFALDTPEALAALSPNFELSRYFASAGLTGDAVIVMQPEAITALGSALTEAKLSTVQHYLALQVARQFAPMLSQDFVDAHFDFYHRTLRGTAENRPRWTHAVAAVEHALGEALGKRYVAAHFPPEAKVRMERMVAHLIDAYRSSIEDLDWMSDATREKALEKLARFNTKIGHPEQWRSYADLRVQEGELVGNYRRATAFETRRQLGKQGQPVDRSEWFMTPQTVNAYYSPTMNEIVFPAAILQPPFFDLDADDAINYGAIGAVIGHEIGHGFDDQGSKYDGDGNLNNWWTVEDRDAFEARTATLVTQYNAFCPVEGHCVNGALSLGENIGDLGGLSIAYKAYLRSVGELPPPIIDGYTAEQRLFIGWAQVWARKFREQELISRLRTGPHAPDEFRANGIVRNIDAWYDAFDIDADAALYLPPEERVRIW